MHLFSKKAAKKMAAYQKELIETHYQEVDNMYRQMRGWRHDYRGAEWQIRAASVACR